MRTARSSTATVTIHESAADNPQYGNRGGPGNVQTDSSDADGSLLLSYTPLGLSYNSSDADPRPIVSMDVRLQMSNGSGSLTQVKADLNFGGYAVPTVTYSATGAKGPSKNNFVFYGPRGLMV